MLHLALWSVLRSAPEASQRTRPTAAGPMRWLSVRLLPAPGAGAEAAPPRAAARTDPPRARPAAPTRRARRVAAVPPQAIAVAPAPAVVPIDGGVFGLPRVGYDGAARASGVRGFAAIASPPVAGQSTHNHNEALGRQIVEHIGRRLDGLPPATAAGRCTVDGADDPQLTCDSDNLRVALDAQAAPLAQLLAAYRRSAPNAEAPIIEVRDGRYRLSMR